MKVRGALETFVSALTPIAHAKGPPNEVQPDIMNTDLLSREAESISLLLSLLVRALIIFYSANKLRVKFMLTIHVDEVKLIMYLVSQRRIFMSGIIRCNF